jgi:hypothetical protein
VSSSTKASVRAVVATPDGLEVLMASFIEFMINEKVQTFWAALQRGEFITDAADKRQPVARIETERHRHEQQQSAERCCSGTSGHEPERCDGGAPGRCLASV